MVIVVEKCFDVGGRAIMSGGQVQLGCGNPLQEAAGIKDSPDQFFLDWTGSDGEYPVDPKRWGTMGNPLARWNDRELIRTFADHAVETYHFLADHGVKFTPRRHARSRGSAGPPQLHTPCPGRWPRSALSSADRNNGYGSGLIRPLEKYARAKGVQFLLLHRMTKIHRETPTSGRVLGVTAEVVDKWNKGTGKTVNIRARKGVIIATGGHNGNVNFRRMYDPALMEEYQTWGAPYTTKDADGEIAGMAVGASLWTLANQTDGGERQYDRPGSSIGDEVQRQPRLLPRQPGVLPCGQYRPQRPRLAGRDHGEGEREAILRGDPAGQAAGFARLAGVGAGGHEMVRRSGEAEWRRADLGDLRCRSGQARKMDPGYAVGG